MTSLTVRVIEKMIDDNMDELDPEIRKKLVTKLTDAIHVIGIFLAGFDEETVIKFCQLIIDEKEISEGVMHLIENLKKMGVPNWIINQQLPLLEAEARRAYEDIVRGVKDSDTSFETTDILVEFAQVMTDKSGETAIEFIVLDEPAEELIQRDMFEGMADWDLPETDGE